MSRREVIQRLRQDCWYEVAHEGSHKQLKHASKKDELPCRILSATSPSARSKALKNGLTKQKTNYDTAIWYSWILYLYLVTYHATIRLLRKQREKKNLRNASHP
jgi:hypothetical protein